MAGEIGLAVVALLLVFLNGFFVLAEFAIVKVRATRLEQLAEKGFKDAKNALRVVSRLDDYLSATQLGITLASLGLGWIGEPALARLFEPALVLVWPADDPATLSTRVHVVSATVAFLIITALHIVLGELAPKTVALASPETISLWVAKPTELFMRGFWPFIRILNGMGRAVVTAFGFKAPSGHALVHSEEELKMLVTASQEAGVLEEQEEQMLHRVFGFGDLTAGQVMIPRTEMMALPLAAALPDVIALVAATPHSRLPVYRNGPDDVVGILHVKDLFKVLASPDASFDLSALLREPLTVPETLPCDDLLAEMQRRGTHHGLVIDEYGGTAGLVTFERLMARIVGDIDGEQRWPRFTYLADGSVLVDGLALVRDVNERFGLHIDEETYNTIGGYVLGRLGRRPRIGDYIDVEGRTLRVEALDGLRVARVFLQRTQNDS
jgi:CBS domain containing-hemolysin-like protein